MDNIAAITLSNQLALTRQMDIVANNIANASTTGFKSERVLFSQYLANLSAPGDQKLAFPQDAGVKRNYDEGPITATGNPLDLAIKGDAFFAVSTANGTRYTRDGSFTLNNQRQVTTAQGNNLLDENGQPIKIPTTQTQISISQDGTVSTEDGQIARIKLVRFADPQALSEEGASMFNPNSAKPLPASGAKVLQGSIEGSNVQSILELSRLLEISRSYQSAQHLMDTENDRMHNAITSLTKDA